MGSMAKRNYSGNTAKRPMTEGNRPRRTRVSISRSGEIRKAEAHYREAQSVALAEPEDLVRYESAMEAFETYEGLCVRYGSCRRFDCYRKTTSKLCREHRKGSNA